MTVTRQPIPPGVELVRLRTTMTYALEVIRECQVYAAQAADVCRRIDPDYAARLDELGADLHNAQAERRVGTPASIVRSLAELLEKA